MFILIDTSIYIYCNVKLRPKWCMYDLDELDIASRPSHKLATDYHFCM